MRPPRDYQRQRMYDWESRHVKPLTDTIRTVPECRVTVALCASLYAVQPPHIKATTRARVRGHAHSNGLISLPEWTRRDYYIIHEAAHHVGYKAFGVMSHGELFMRVLIDLLATVMMIDRTYLETSAFTRGLRVADRDIVTQVPMQEARELTRVYFRQADIDPKTGKPRWSRAASSPGGGSEIEYEDYRLFLKDEFVIRDDDFMPLRSFQ